MIAFTYDLATPVGRVRLYAGDTDPTGLDRPGGDRTRTDAEIAALLAANGDDPRLAAAALLEGKAAEFASAATHITQGGLGQDFRARTACLLEAAAALRASRGAVLFNPAGDPGPFPEE